MADESTKRLLFSIMQFLSEQMSASQLSADCVESIEVAVQCLESAFGISSSDSHLAVSKPLQQIFAEATKSETNINLPAPSEENKQQAEKLKNEGNRLMKEEQFLDAVTSYSRAIELDRTNAVFFCNRAAAHTKMGDHMSAVNDCKMALQIDDKYSKAYGRMGLAYSSLNQHQEARQCYQKAVELEPDNESYLSNLRIAEEKLRQTNLGNGTAPAGMPGLGGLGGMDMGAVLGNPALMNMATQLMSDPQMQNMMGSLMSGQEQGAGGMEALIRAGQQLAQQMQSSNPELVENLRRQMGGGGGGPGGADSPPDGGDKNANS